MGFPTRLRRLLIVLGLLGILGGSSACFAPDPFEVVTEPIRGSAPGVSSPPSRAEPARRPLPPLRSRAIARNAEGDLVLFDTRDGRPIARAAGAGLGGVGDVAVDKGGQRAVAFEGDPEATWGEISTYALIGERLGARVHRAYLDGDARILPVRGGILQFEDGPAPRWKLLRDDGAPAIGIPMARPASIVVREGPSSLRIDALAYAEAATPGAMQLEAAEMKDGVLSSIESDPLSPVEINTLPGIEGSAATARYARTSRLGAALIADVSPDGITLAAIQSGHLEAPSVVPLSAKRIEAMIPLGEDAIALLLSGPSRVAVIALHDAPGLAVQSFTDLLLAGEVRVEDRFFSRDMAALGPARLFAATGFGLFAFDVDIDRGVVTMTMDTHFEGASLRGPIALVP